MTRTIKLTIQVDGDPEALEVLPTATDIINVIRDTITSRGTTHHVTLETEYDE